MSAPERPAKLSGEKWHPPWRTPRPPLRRPTPGATPLCLLLVSYSHRRRCRVTSDCSYQWRPLPAAPAIPAAWFAGIRRSGFDPQEKSSAPNLRPKQDRYKVM
ncbi:hypothetical protein GUJ93_ZPchr0013g35595 [Zizania palustris]|uniref:Uncharacterized protein n=1 Tax=Zizania palustris TaxID=103762 RepID=A0A8J5X1W2_ZIZPA|nr:hypothetical protein GUJ93_ZPchr0013g35595 [Zizania palustris]